MKQHLEHQAAATAAAARSNSSNSQHQQKLEQESSIWKSPKSIWKSPMSLRLSLWTFSCSNTQQQLQATAASACSNSQQQQKLGQERSTMKSPMGRLKRTRARSGIARLSLNSTSSKSSSQQQQQQNLHYHHQLHQRHLLCFVLGQGVVWQQNPQVRPHQEDHLAMPMARQH